ncbi:MAG: GlsB/YeaQ/YmgE family stress response membrane protein [Pseudomonadota bacterium]
MTGMGIIMSIILGGFAGWVAERIMKADHGLFMNIILGILGALGLNFALGFLGIVPAAIWYVQLVVAIAGACILIYLGRIIRSR